MATFFDERKKKNHEMLEALLKFSSFTLGLL